MDQYGYGARQNGYDDREGAGRAPPSAAFGQGPRPGGGAARYNQGPATVQREEYGSNNVEMAPLAQNAVSFGGGGGGDPNAILNECRDVDRGVDQIEANLQQLRMLQERSLNEADQSSGSATQRQLDALSSDTMAMYRSLTDRVRQIKSSPDSRQPRNTAQVNRIDKRLKQAITAYQQVESQFRKKTQDQMARQYRIVRPDAGEAEVRAAVEDSGNGGQMFQQALMQSGRQGQARAVLNAVQDRQRELQKIEQQMVELAQLFQDMDTLVVQQDVAIAQIEQKSEEVVENLDKANEEIEVAVQTARKTRKKKWCCLLLCLSIVAAIAVAVVVYMAVTGKLNFGGNKETSNSSSSSGNSGTTSTTTSTPPATTSGATAANKRRSLWGGSNAADDVHMEGRDVPVVKLAGERPLSRIFARSNVVVVKSEMQSRAVVPGVEWKGDEDKNSKRVMIPGVEWKSDDGKHTKRAVLPGVEWKSDDGTHAKRAVLPGVEWKGEDAQGAHERAVVSEAARTVDVGAGGKWVLKAKRTDTPLRFKPPSTT